MVIVVLQHLISVLVDIDKMVTSLYTLKQKLLLRQDGAGEERGVSNFAHVRNITG